LSQVGTATWLDRKYGPKDYLHKGDSGFDWKPTLRAPWSFR
jgi:hypothetical protein